jgi:hypothetical protein
MGHETIHETLESNECMDTLAWPFLIPIVAMVGVFAVLIVRAVMQARVRELEVRERIAMIERGLVPPPEKDPQAFDRLMGTYDRYRERIDADRRSRHTPGRYRTGGMTMIGIGLGMILLIGVAGGEMNQGLGVGGFLVVLGLAFFINSWLVGGRAGTDRYPPPSPIQAPPAGAPGTGPSNSSANEPPH